MLVAAFAAFAAVTVAVAITYSDFNPQTKGIGITCVLCRSTLAGLILLVNPLFGNMVVMECSRDASPDTLSLRRNVQIRGIRSLYFFAFFLDKPATANLSVGILFSALRWCGSWPGGSVKFSSGHFGLATEEKQ